MLLDLSQSEDSYQSDPQSSEQLAQFMLMKISVRSCPRTITAGHRKRATQLYARHQSLGRTSAGIFQAASGAADRSSRMQGAEDVREPTLFGLCQDLEASLGLSLIHI